jgi:molecular chaperone DnaK (HSP70)
VTAGPGGSRWSLAIDFGTTNTAAAMVVPEPVAAAWFYARPVAGAVTGVFDLGGGTLDVAVLRSDGRRYTVAGPPGGDPHLDGEDFDDALLGKVESLARARDAARGPQLCFVKRAGVLLRPVQVNRAHA